MGGCMAGVAKISKPRLFRVAPRERLFARLDELGAMPATWVCGAPGAGKTTLVASYVEARQRSVLWFHADEGDSDPASFYWYLSRAAEPYRRKRGPLPVLAPEYLADLPGFNRRFCRELFERAPADAIIVFDNLQCLPAESSSSALLAGMIDEVPDGVSILLVSRAEPPEAFAPLRANERLGLLDDAELRLTEAEAGAICAQRGVIDATVVQRRWRRAGGWTAGLILGLADSDRAHEEVNAAADSEHGADKPAVFAYFAQALLRGLPSQTRSVLQATAYLPTFTVEMAASLSGEAGAANVLERMYQDRMFIVRRGIAPVRYQYHDLLREFLQSPGGGQVEPARRAVIEASAHVLVADGDMSGGIDLFLQLGEHGEAARLIVEIAQGLMQQGRWMTLRAWLAQLPHDIVAAEPWLMFWRGACHCFGDPVGARDQIMAALEVFRAQHDPLGQIMSASLAVQSFFLDWGNFGDLDSWIPELERLFDLAPATGSQDLELRAASSLLVACLYRRLNHPRIQEVALRARDLIEMEGDVNLRLSTGTFLLHYPFFLGHEDISGPRVAALCERLVAEAQAMPITRAMFHFPYAYYLHSTGQYEAAERSADAATSIARQHGLTFLEAGANWLSRMDTALFSGDFARFKALVAGCEAHLLPSRPTDLGWWHMRVAGVRYFECDFDSAVEHSLRAVQYGRSSGMSLVEIFAWFCLAQIHADRGDWAGGSAALDGAASAYDHARNPVASEAIGMCRAYLHLRAGAHAQCDRELLAALGIARAHNIPHNIFLLHPLLTALLERALEQNLEPEYARRVIHTRRLRPPSLESEHWPWPLQVRTLGRFSLVIAGSELELGSAAQRKTIELLKALIAMGSADVDIARLQSVLWPGTEPAAARRSFDTALHRLRKLAPKVEWLILEEGRLSIDSGTVWLDLAALPVVAGRMGRAIADGDHDAVNKSVAQLLRLYQGDFLANDVETPWSLPARDRARASFSEALEQAGRHFESAHAWSDAETVYKRALTADNLAEPFYRGLIRCHLARRESAEALLVYRRCRELLSVVLNLQPSAETQGLVRDIYA